MPKSGKKSERADERDDRKGLKPLALSTVSYGHLSLLRSPKTISKIAFGSCLLQDQPQPIWRAIRKKEPDLFIFLGDNIYADTMDMDEMQRKYAMQEARPEYKKFRKSVPIIATWDDHDYAYDDAGAEVPREIKKASKAQFLRFCREPKNSDRWNRHGVYTSYLFGEHPRSVQIILLDLRWWKSALEKDEAGAYLPSGAEGALLGEAQWDWLEAQFKVKADVRILGSSIQFASSEHPHEKWANFPHEKTRLLDLVDKQRINNLFVLSGDMHFGELSMEKTGKGVEIFDLTASGLNRFEEIAKDNPNSKRIKAHDKSVNFGLVTIEWDHQPPRVKLEVRDKKGACVIKHKVICGTS